MSASRSATLALEYELLVPSGLCEPQEYYGRGSEKRLMGDEARVVQHLTSHFTHLKAHYLLNMFQLIRVNIMVKQVNFFCQCNHFL
jgi:hypothetical protein